MINEIEREPVLSEFVDPINYPPPGFVRIDQLMQHPDIAGTALDPFGLVWQSTPKFWSDRDVFRRWQDAIVALHALTTRVNDQGEIEEVKFSEDEERRLHAALNLAIATCELVFRSLDTKVAELRKQLDEMQRAAQMQSEELMAITHALMPSSMTEEN